MVVHTTRTGGTLTLVVTIDHKMVGIFCFLFHLMMVMSMEIGKGGVYDSPLATDRYVRQFGFLFGGGRSGVKGIEAFQVSFTLLNYISYY